MIGHYDERVEFVVAFGSVALEGFEEEFGMAIDLKETAAVVGYAGDEVGAGGGRCGPGSPLVPQGLKPRLWLGGMARLKPCP